MSTRFLTKEKSDKNLKQTGYVSPDKDKQQGSKRHLNRGASDNFSTDDASSRTSSGRFKNFNEDGTCNREFNRDGSLRSIGKENSVRFKKRNGEHKPKEAEVIGVRDLDSFIKQVSSKDLITCDEIDDFIQDIEGRLDKGLSIDRRPSMRKTLKNSDQKMDSNGDYDRYGFLIMKTDDEAYVPSSSQVQKALDKEDERIDKWIYMLNNWDTFFLRKFNKVKSRVRKGIPHAIRGEAWYRLAHVEDMKLLFPNALDLENVENQLTEQVIDDIDRDVNRTFPYHERFQEGGPGQEAMRRILLRYAILDPYVGYCQGMGFLTAMLLQYLNEADAFFALVSLMSRPSLPFRGMYSPKMEDTKKTLAVFADLASIKVPNVWSHLVQQGVHHSMYVTSWIMTVFISSFHFDFAVRVWDVLWLEGWKTVYRVCLGLLKYAEPELMTCSMEEIMMYFRKMRDRMNPDEVWKAVWSIKLTQDEITQCENWYSDNGGAGA